MKIRDKSSLSSFQAMTMSRLFIFTFFFELGCCNWEEMTTVFVLWLHTGNAVTVLGTATKVSLRNNISIVHERTLRCAFK